MQARDNITEEIKEAARRSEQMPFRAMDKVWDSIEEKLDEDERINEEKRKKEPRKEKRIIAFRTVSIAAAVSIVISLGTTYFLQKNNTQQRNDQSYAQHKKKSITPESKVNNGTIENVPIVDNNKQIEIVKQSNELKAKPGEAQKKANAFVVKTTVPDPGHLKIAPLQQDAFVLQRIVKGKVTDQNGDPVAGAIVSAKSAKENSITDFDGNYEIKINNDEQQLMIRRLGLLSKNIELQNESIIGITLEQDKTKTDQIENRSYESGIANNKSAGGSTKSISDIEKAIEGELPGVKISKFGGRASFGNDYFEGNANPSNRAGSPLVVIDGMFYSGSSVSLKPDEVVSLTVLKDDKAISAYGSKGTNGVIIIKTKSGKGFSEPKQNLIQKVKKILDRKEKDEE